MWLWVSGTGPPQAGLSGSGRVGSPKAHRPPTFHVGSAPATGTDREHPGACLPLDQSTRVGAASLGVRSRAGQQRLGQGGPTAPGRDPPPCQGPHSVPRKGPGGVLRGVREAAPGLFWGSACPLETQPPQLLIVPRPMPAECGVASKVSTSKGWNAAMGNHSPAGHLQSELAGSTSLAPWVSPHPPPP